MHCLLLCVESTPLQETECKVAIRQMAYTQMVMHLPLSISRKP